MSHFLPPALLALFAPRPPLEYKEPMSKRGNRQITGIGPVRSCFLSNSVLSKMLDLCSFHCSTWDYLTKPQPHRFQQYHLKLQGSVVNVSNVKEWQPQKENSTMIVISVCFLHVACFVDMRPQGIPKKLKMPQKMQQGRCLLVDWYVFTTVLV